MAHINGRIPFTEQIQSKPFKEFGVTYINISIMTDPWDERYSYLQEWSVFMGSKQRNMDPLGWKNQCTNRILTYLRSTFSILNAAAISDKLLSSTNILALPGPQPWSFAVVDSHHGRRSIQLTKQYQLVKWRWQRWKPRGWKEPETTPSLEQLLVKLRCKLQWTMCWLLTTSTTGPGLDFPRWCRKSRNSGFYTINNPGMDDVFRNPTGASWCKTSWICFRSVVKTCSNSWLGVRNYTDDTVKEFICIISTGLNHQKSKYYCRWKKSCTTLDVKNTL